MRCCAIIPAYQEACGIARVVEGALRYADEVLVVDDGSSDGTFERAAGAGAQVVRHRFNAGKGAALGAGLKWAAGGGYEAAVTLDGDGQHDPAEIPRLLDALGRGSDIVVGCRMDRPDGMPLDRLLTNMLMSTALSVLTKRRLRDTQSGFKALRVTKVRGLKLRTSRFDWESELLIKAAQSGLRVSEVGVSSIYVNHHRSKIKVVPDAVRFVKLVLLNVVH